MIWQQADPTADEVAGNLERYRERVALYREFGHDREQAIRFVIDSAEPIGPPVLDIGTGKGFASVEIARRGHRVDSIDIVEDELHYALLNAKAAAVDDLVTFHIGDARKLPFENEQYGLVTMVNVLHHVDRFEPVITEVSRVLKPGGRFVVADFTEEGFSILDRIHTEEGREHPRRCSAGIEDVAAILPANGMICRGRDERFQEYVMIAEKL